MIATELLKLDLKPIGSNKGRWDSLAQANTNSQFYYGQLTKGTNGNQAITVKLRSEEKMKSSLEMLNPERLRLTKPSKRLVKMKSKSYRSTSSKVSIGNRLALQIKILREKSGLSQAQLAKKLNTRQSAIARLEDMNYGKQSLAMLNKLSDIFDVALSVEFVSFSKFLRQTSNLSPQSLTPNSYNEEFGNSGEPTVLTDLEFDGSVICYQNYLSPEKKQTSFFIKKK